MIEEFKKATGITDEVSIEVADASSRRRRALLGKALKITFNMVAAKGKAVNTADFTTPAILTKLTAGMEASLEAATGKKFKLLLTVVKEAAKPISAGVPTLSAGSTLAPATGKL